MRTAVLAVLLAFGCAAAPAVRAADNADGCGGRFVRGAACTFRYQGAGLTVHAVALSRTIDAAPTAPVPSLRAPFVVVQVVWSHTRLGSEPVQDVVMECAVSGVDGVAAIPCSGSDTPVGVDVGALLLCRVVGRDLGAYACGTTALPLPPLPRL